MGGHSKSQPKPQPTLQVDTPSVDVAQVAAEKALAAQGNVRASQAAEDDKKQPTATNLGAPATAQPQAKKRTAQAPGSTVSAAPMGGMSTSAVLTG